MPPWIVPVLIIPVVAAAIGVVVYFNYRWEQQRTERLRQAADELGFEFSPAGDSVLESWLAKFRLFSQGHSRKLWNVLRGRTADLDVAVFDYKYTVGSGKNARTYKTSAACFRAEDLAVPEFGLRPEGFWLRVGAAVFGFQDIDFDTHPKFSRNYLLRGPDEEAIRAAFTPTVLDYYEDRPGLSTEGAGNVLLFYRHGVRIDPADVRAFLEDGFAVLGLFRHAKPSGADPGDRDSDRSE